VKLLKRGEKHSHQREEAEDRNTPIIIPGSQRTQTAQRGKSHANSLSHKHKPERGQHLPKKTTNRSQEGGGSGSLDPPRGYITLDEKQSAPREIAKSETEEPTRDVITTTNGTKNHTHARDGESAPG
jgi:hypothetical protein